MSFSVVFTFWDQTDVVVAEGFESVECARCAAQVLAREAPLGVDRPEWVEVVDARWLAVDGGLVTDLGGVAWQRLAAEPRVLDGSDVVAVEALRVVAA